MTERAVPVWQMAALALLSAAALALCFPPADVGWLAGLALMPLFLAWRGARSPAQGILVALLTGLPFYGWINSYLLLYGTLPTAALAVLQTLPLLLVGALAVPLLRARNLLLRVLLLPALWVLAEWLRAHLGTLSLSYGQLGYTMHATLPLLQWASVGGVLGLSFLLALFSSALAELVWELRRSDCGGACLAWITLGAIFGLAVLIWIGGYIRLLQPAFQPGSFRVGVVQADLQLPAGASPDAEEFLLSYTWYTDQLMAATVGPGADPVTAPRPQLVVWPETAVPVALNRHPVYWEALRKTATQHEIWLLAGAWRFAAGGERYNSAYLFAPTGDLTGISAKRDLVMFGEYVPLREQLPWLSRYPIRDFDVTPGGPRTLMQVGENFFGTLICFEAIFPEQSRELVRGKAEFLVFLTSDAWAGDSAELLVHSYTAPFRAVENARWVVRAATTGISAVISPTGAIAAFIPAGQAGYCSARIAPRTDLTLYTRLGDWPLLLFLLLVVWTAWRSRLAPPPAAPPAWTASAAFRATPRPPLPPA